MFIQTIRKTGAFNVKNLGADNLPNNTIDSTVSPASPFLLIRYHIWRFMTYTF